MDEMGMVSARERPIAIGVVELLLLLIIIDYLSSNLYYSLRSDMFNSYNIRDSENKLAVPLPPKK